MPKHKPVSVIMAADFPSAFNLGALFDITIGAEWDSNIMEGRDYTAAHHQRTGKFGRQEHLCPCVDDRLPTITTGTILLGNFALDNVGACLRCMGFNVFTGHELFWSMVAYIDNKGVMALEQFKDEPWIKGFYNLDGLGACELAYLAWQEWAQLHLSPPPDACEDVTDKLPECAAILYRLLVNKDLLPTANSLRILA